MKERPKASLSLSLSQVLETSDLLIGNLKPKLSILISFYRSSSRHVINPMYPEPQFPTHKHPKA